MAKVPSTDFFMTTCFAALAIVGGAAGIFFEARDHSDKFFGPSIVLALGITLIALAFLGEKPGRAHKIVIGLRNSLIALFALAIVLTFLLLLIDPFG